MNFWMIIILFITILFWDVMIAFITWPSNLVRLLEGLCSSNPCRFESSVFGVFARILIFSFFFLVVMPPHS